MGFLIGGNKPSLTMSKIKRLHMRSLCFRLFVVHSVCSITRWKLVKSKNQISASGLLMYVKQGNYLAITEKNVLQLKLMEERMYVTLFYFSIY